MGKLGKGAGGPPANGGGGGVEGVDVPAEEPIDRCRDEDGMRADLL